MEKIKITIALWLNGVRIYREDFSGEIGSVSAFKKKIKDILATDYARQTLSIDMEKKRIKVSIGRWNYNLEMIEDWTNMSKLSKDFLNSSNRYDYVISLI